MSDNVNVLPASGADVVPAAADLLPDGSYAQRVKIIVGADGANDGDVASGNPLPVSVLDSALPLGAATEATLAAIQALMALARTSGPGPFDKGSVVRQAPADMWTVSFTDSGSGLLAADFTQRALGSGVSVSQASGNLVVAAGTTANAEFLARSTKAWSGTFIARHKTILSQRIANNNFAVLMADRVGEGLACTINSATSITVAFPGHSFTAANIGQFMNIGGISGAAGVPGRYAIASVVAGVSITFTVAGWPASGSCVVDLFGWNYYRTLYSGVTPTAAAIDAQRRGWATGDSTATINTTASPGHMMQIAVDGRNAYFADALVASSLTPTITVRGSRVENIPDDDVELYLYLWAFNGTTAPASSTSWTLGFVSVEDIVNVPFYLAGLRPQGFAAPLPVAFPAAQSVNATLVASTVLAGDVGQQYRANATGAASVVPVMSPAAPAVTGAKAAAGRLLGLHLQNSAAALRSVKFFNALPANVTFGTTVAVFEVDIPPGGSVDFTFEGGVSFSTAITYAVTTAKGLTDTTSGGSANDVSGFIAFA